jgi:hypothetical protein
MIRTKKILFWYLSQCINITKRKSKRSLIQSEYLEKKRKQVEKAKNLQGFDKYASRNSFNRPNSALCMYPPVGLYDPINTNKVPVLRNYNKESKTAVRPKSEMVRKCFEVSKIDNYPSYSKAVDFKLMLGRSNKPKTSYFFNNSKMSYDLPKQISFVKKVPEFNFGTVISRKPMGKQSLCRTEIYNISYKKKKFYTPNFEKMQGRQKENSNMTNHMNVYEDYDKPKKKVRVIDFSKQIGRQ